MSSQSLKVHVEFGELKADLEGNADEVVKALLQFIMKAYPNLESLSKFTFAPNYLEILNDISDSVKITADAQLVLVRRDFPADQAIGLALLGANVAYKLGKLENDELSVESLCKIMGKAPKTIQNTLVEMVKEGIVDRSSRGAYVLTPVGIMQVHEAAKSLSNAEKSQRGSEG